MTLVQTPMDPRWLTLLANYGAPLIILVYFGEKAFALLRWYLGRQSSDEGLSVRKLEMAALQDSDNLQRRDIEKLKASYEAMYVIVGNLQTSAAAMAATFENGILPRLVDLAEHVRDLEKRSG